jgi:hypothetical protein
MKFQIGDKVKFKNGLKIGNCYDGFGFSSDMHKQRNKTFEIVEEDTEDFRIKSCDDKSDFMCAKYWVTEIMIDLVERVHKRIFVNQSDRKQYGSYKYTDLGKCPKCEDIMHWNNHNTLYIDKDGKNKKIKIITQYCEMCDELYIRCE